MISGTNFGGGDSEALVGKWGRVPDGGGVTKFSPTVCWGTNVQKNHFVNCYYNIDRAHYILIL